MRYVIRLEGFVGKKHASMIAKALHHLWPELQVTATARPSKRRKVWKQSHAAVEPKRKPARRRAEKKMTVTKAA